jgi:GMP synthase PP-ATPase subunit
MVVDMAMWWRWVHLPYEFLNHVSRRIINEIDGIPRVTYDIYGKPRRLSSGSRMNVRSGLAL